MSPSCRIAAAFLVLASSGLAAGRAQACTPPSGDEVALRLHESFRQGERTLFYPSPRCWLSVTARQSDDSLDGLGDAAAVDANDLRWGETLAAPVHMTRTDPGHAAELLSAWFAGQIAGTASIHDTGRASILDGREWRIFRVAIAGRNFVTAVRLQRDQGYYARLYIGGGAWTNRVLLSAASQ